MKLTLGWLKRHLETDASLEDIARTLTAIGLEVDGIEDRAALYDPFRVAFVRKAEKHPDADRLKVCQVETADGVVQVVCGAPNAREGMKGIFAPAGSMIPGTDMLLKKGKIRGQESNGMLVSEREMGLSDEHTGIIEVDPETPVGTKMADLYGLADPVIEIGLTPDRPDCAGIRGIARDLAAAGLGRLLPLDTSPVKGSFNSPTEVEIHVPQACPLYLGRTIRGVKNGPSPKWMQDLLKAVGLRPISALVDVTNFLTMDLCRPLHVFDLAKLSGNVIVRAAKDGETLDALNDKSYTLAAGQTAITDKSGVLGLGGIIGGVSSGCTEGTTDIFIEAAYFDPMRTARTGRDLQIESDARYRFERGIDPAFTFDGMEIATRLILELCGTKNSTVSNVVKAGGLPQLHSGIDYPLSEFKRLSGIDLPESAQTEIFDKLGFSIEEPKGEPGRLFLIPPPWRPDVEDKADIVEEVLRIHGYDNVPDAPVRAANVNTTGVETPRFRRARLTRTALAARGMTEVVSWSFMPDHETKLFGLTDDADRAALRLVNPINAEMDMMRPSILPNLIRIAGTNRDKGFGDVALFEIGPVFRGTSPEAQPLVAAGLRDGANGARHWSGKDAARPVDVFDAKADALAALEAAGAPAASLQVTRDAPDWYHPGRSGAFRLGANVIGWFGELHPAVLGELDRKGVFVGFELFLDQIPAPKKKGNGRARPLLKLSALQPVSRDFAFIVDENVEADAILRAVRGGDKKYVSNAGVFDVYAGKGVEDGKKSVAVSVTLQPVDQTLTDAELDAVSRRIVDNVASRTGATLRA